MRRTCKTPHIQLPKFRVKPWHLLLCYFLKNNVLWCSISRSNSQMVSFPVNWLGLPAWAVWPVAGFLVSLVRPSWIFSAGKLLNEIIRSDIGNRLHSICLHWLSFDKTYIIWCKCSKCNNRKVLNKARWLIQMLHESAINDLNMLTYMVDKTPLKPRLHSSATCILSLILHHSRIESHRCYTFQSWCR